MTGTADKDARDWSAKHTRLRWGMFSSAILLYWLSTHATDENVMLPLLSISLQVPRPEAVLALALFSLFQWFAFGLRTFEERSSVAGGWSAARKDFDVFRNRVENLVDRHRDLLMDLREIAREGNSVSLNVEGHLREIEAMLRREKQNIDWFRLASSFFR